MDCFVALLLAMTNNATAPLDRARRGQIAIQGALVRKRCAALSMLPQDGAGGCWPRPRNDSAASAMIAAAIDSVACTKSAGMMLGRMWNSAMRQRGLPMARAASI